MCPKRENSNTDLTVDILYKVFFPGIGMDYGCRGGFLVDNFKGHGAYNVNNFKMRKIVTMVICLMSIDTIFMPFRLWQD